MMTVFKEAEEIVSRIYHRDSNTEVPGQTGRVTLESMILQLRSALEIYAHGAIKFQEPRVLRTNRGKWTGQCIRSGSMYVYVDAVLAHTSTEYAIFDRNVFNTSIQEQTGYDKKSGKPIFKTVPCIPRVVAGKIPYVGSQELVKLFLETYAEKTAAYQETVNSIWSDAESRAPELVSRYIKGHTVSGRNKFQKKLGAFLSKSPILSKQDPELILKLLSIDRKSLEQLASFAKRNEADLSYITAEDIRIAKNIGIVTSVSGS